MFLEVIINQMYYEGISKLEEKKKGKIIIKCIMKELANCRRKKRER